MTTNSPEFWAQSAQQLQQTLGESWSKAFQSFQNMDLGGVTGAKAGAASLPPERQYARMAVSAGTLLLASTPSQAVPSFARQTGQECAACHIGAYGPQLTPYGVKFKIGGYTDSDGKEGKVPLSGMAVASFTHTNKKQDEEPGPNTKKNNNFAFCPSKSRSGKVSSIGM